MKLYGRITIFGEYLLHENLSHCLCVKSSLFLTNDTLNNETINTYDKSKDIILSLLEKMQIKSTSAISGNLPIGYGLSSSTIISFLHLKKNAKYSLIKSIDKKINGFSPSELDYVSISNQETGVFGDNKWTAFNEVNIVYSLVIIPKEKKNKLPVIQNRIKINQKKQIDLTQKLFQILQETNKLDYNLYLKYCNLLIECDIYSRYANTIISDLLSSGIATKCIGGLYDKAIIVVHKSKKDKIKIDDYLLSQYKEIELFE